jgi:hypothetical protein
MATVPARDFDPSMVQARTLPFDLDQKLDTGMTAVEAVRRAEHWWEKTGAKEMRLHGLRHTQTVGGSLHGIGGAFASLDPKSENYLPSGIIHGKPWDDLTKREKAMVVKAWHHFYIRKPDLLGENPDDPLKGS